MKQVARLVERSVLLREAPLVLRWVRQQEKQPVVQLFQLESYLEK